jgi:glycosyltransferase involved in cell wall biosynthesis
METMVEQMRTTDYKPLVGIIMPVYNQERFVHVAIKSVLMQTYDNWELIIVDDGSIDNTLKAISNFNDPRIRIVSHEHLGLEGLSQTYNKALSISSGEIIAILEGDDYWPVDKLEKQVKSLEDPEVVLSFGLCLYVDEKGNILGKSKGVNFNEARGCKLRKMFFFSNFIPSVTVMVRKKMLISHGFIGINGVPFVDFPTWFSLTYKGKFVYVNDILGNWRLHTGQTTEKLWLMEVGELKAYNYFWRKGYINLIALVICVSISLIKYLKRLIVKRVINKVLNKLFGNLAGNSRS